MRLPWKRPVEVDTEEIERAKQQLAKARADEPRVDRIHGQLKRQIRENHFGPRIAAALREGHR